MSELVTPAFISYWIWASDKPPWILLFAFGLPFLVYTWLPASAFHSQISWCFSLVILSLSLSLALVKYLLSLCISRTPDPQLNVRQRKKKPVTDETRPHNWTNCVYVPMSGRERERERERVWVWKYQAHPPSASSGIFSSLYSFLSFTSSWVKLTLSLT